MPLIDTVLQVLGYLSLLGLSVFGIIRFVLRRIQSHNRQKRKESLESSLEDVERAVQVKIGRDFGVIPDNLPVRVIPTIQQTSILAAPVEESVQERITRRVRRKKAERERTIVLHVQDYEIDFGQPSPETQEDIIKWTVVANTQRKSREYMPFEIANAIVKRKTQEYSFELANERKVSSECIEVAEHEDVEPRTYRKVSALSSEEISNLQRIAQDGSSTGPSVVHECREKVREVLDKCFTQAVSRRIIETRTKVKKAGEVSGNKQLRLVEELLEQAESALDADAQTAFDYADRAEGTLKTTLESMHQIILERVEEFPPRKKRELDIINWSGVTLGKSSSVGRYAKPELDQIRDKFGGLSAIEIAELSYRFGVILVYIYNFPGRTPPEIAEETTLLPTTVAAEVHFLEKLGYVRSIRRERMARRCYPQVSISSLHANGRFFLGKHVLIVADHVSPANVNGRKVFDMSGEGSGLRFVLSELAPQSVEEKIRNGKFAVGIVRELKPEEASLSTNTFIVEVDDQAALVIQEAIGFETGKQEVLESFFASRQSGY